MGHSEATEKVFFTDKVPGIVAFSPKLRHVLAVRYSNFDRTPLRRDYFSPGFIFLLGNWARTQTRVQIDLLRQTVFTTILAVLAFIHLILFIFNPTLKENLLYSISTLGGVGVWVANTQWNYSVSARYIGFLDAAAQVFAEVAILFGLLLVYSFQNRKLPKRVRLYLVIGTGFAIWGSLEWNTIYQLAQNIFIVAMLLEMVWGIIRTARNEMVGGVILMFGFSALAASFIYSTLGGYGLLPQSFPTVDNSFIYGFVSLGIAMSIFLSRRFARTRRDLEMKLVEVKQLSEQTIAQERQARELEVERRLLAVDNERKT